MKFRNGSINAMLFFAAALLTWSLQASEKVRITEISLERTSCYGTCPQYKLTIRGDGAVAYEGKEFVTAKGAKTSRISREDFLKLEKKINEIGFFSLKEKYDSQQIGDSFTMITDQPSQIVIVKAGDRIKKIEDYFGGPTGLRQLEELIDKTTNSSAWIGERPGSDIEDMPYYDSFPLNRHTRYRGLIERVLALPDTQETPSYELVLVKNYLHFVLRAPADVELSQFEGYIVDAAGTLTQEPKIGEVFTATAVHPVRRISEPQGGKK